MVINVSILAATAGHLHQEVHPVQQVREPRDGPPPQREEADHHADLQSVRPRGHAGHEA